MAKELILEGFKEFKDKLKNLPREVLDEIDFEARDAALLWEQLAKAGARVRTGQMRAQIKSGRVSFLNYEVTDNKFYAPYNEWGTITKVSVPAELAAYAIQFKGKGVRKTGGITPKPFFFPPKTEVQEFLVNRITKILTTEH